MNSDFRINNFDLLRLFAAVEVLLLHSFMHLDIPYPSFFKIMSYFPGVSMFFVMSGFLISASLERNNDLKIYFKNRALRIFPALWACLILTVITISAFSNISFLNQETLPWFLSQLVGFIYTPSFLKGFGFGSYNGSLWTIPLELQFYVVLPIIYFLCRKFTTNEGVKTIIISSIFLFFLIITYFIRDQKGYGDTETETITLKILRYTFIPNICLFLFGVILQRFKIYTSKLISGKGLYWTLAYIVFVYLTPFSTFSEMFKLLFLGVTTISLAYSAPNLSKKLLKGNDISYGMYIYHGLVLGVVVHLKGYGNTNNVAIILIITTIIAILSWLFVEKPFMAKKKKSIHQVDETSLHIQIA